MTATEVLAALLAARTAIDGFFAAAKHVTPEFLQGAEDTVQAQIDGALAELDTLAADLPSAIADVNALIKAGRGPTAGGADATLA